MAGRKKYVGKRISYKREKILIRQPKLTGDVDIDEATKILEESLRPTNNVPPNGKCQSCEKPIPPGRRLCGRCYARNEKNHVR